ncbi:ubiquitin carboxyl-terminal hydrolase 47-like isoform X2 [Mercenaria mercenaria]|uniref:ubiquitin carboxyl-terminal hydrolase 47-like isoform X2 n=1 Tax=Mercenaria mercenaria TaxID=6596 RepID=UPI00234EDF04|nr:ubiquitin carboxyl-terminal hydrolase 47-like isoform X2 [Mercenaria mercenaria]
MVVGDTTQVVPLEGASVADEPKVLCIVRDMVDPQANAIKHTMNLPASMSVQILLNEVAKQFGYMMGTISVHYERQTGSDVEELSLEQYTMSFLGDILSPGVKRHNFTICELEGKQPKKMAPPPPPPPPNLGKPIEGSDAGASGSSRLDSSTYFSNNTSLEPRTAYNSVSSTSSASYSSDFSYSSTFLKSETGYVGLVNQAMTCYLNSLIQTLYMTPEFRNAIYRFHFDSGKGVKNIPYQLQRLFLLLQTSTKRAVETTDLTKSFGWDSSEVWQQHDVQELCRVMFDALEVTWRGTDQENLVNQLYQGKMKDYVKCLECGNESARIDTYLDIPLVIRPFGSTTAYKSVTEALEAFVQPETLEGRDQYFCEKCNKKCDAHKGLKFLSFPYLLTLQMKRFDFDYATMHRIKLNDKMTFPEVLNLNYLTEDLTEEGTTEEKSPDVIETDSVQKDQSIDEGIEMEVSSSAGSINEDSNLSNDTLNDRNAQHSNVKGPYVYELFSIMIHSGSAAGGHYYAYIKCLSDGQWYSFNDQHVSKITYDDIRKTYGGSSTTRGYYSSSYASSANAYMLMYRKIDKDRNIDFMCGEDFPEHVKVELRKLNDKEEADRKQKEMDKSTCKIKIFCVHPSRKKKLDHKLEIHKDKTLSEATDLAYKIFELEDSVTRDCCRIVKYDEYQDSLECSFDDSDDVAMETLLNGVKQSYSFDLLLETKRPEQKFQEYKPGGVTVKVYVADLEKDTIIEPAATVRAYLVQTVQEFKTLVSQVLGLKQDDMRCVLERFHNDLKLLYMPNKTLKSEGFFKTNKVYVELNATEEERNTQFDRSHFYTLLDRYQNTINIQVSLPSLAEVSDYKRHSCARENSPLGQDSAVESGVNSSANSVDNGSEMCNHERRTFRSRENLTDRESFCRDLDTEIRTLNLQSQLSQSDPNLYGSSRHSDGVSKGDILNSLHNRGSGSSLECQDSRSCSQSTQSTSTSAEFSLGNVNSVCEGNLESPDDVVVSNSDKECDLNATFSEKEQSNDLEDCDLKEKLGSGEPVEHVFSESSLPSANLPKTTNSPEDENISVFKSESDIKGTSGWEKHGRRQATTGWDESTGSTSACFDSMRDSQTTEDAEEEKRFFQAELCETDSDQRSLSVFVDKRITLGCFKAELEQYVGVSANNFKVYRVYSNNQEFESIRLTETLSFLEDGRINIKLGRALKNGEYRVKVFQLLVNETEPSKFLLDTIFARGMTVLDSKKMILPEIKLEHNLDVPLDRCRLRKKTWKNPGTIYVDKQVYEEEIPIYPNWEVFLEILDGPEQMLSSAQLAVYLRRWYPSKYELGPFEEVVITEQTVEELKKKISELHGINTEDIEMAKGRGTFPYDVSVLEIHTDLDWNPPVQALGMWPLYICDDGCLVYYRDSKEKLAELSDNMKKEIETKENTRLSKSAQRVTYSPRKERALKIYTEEPAPSNNLSASNASPDLD